jgi:putative zinc finger/helix-turn-helix YgiT family protein
MTTAQNNANADERRRNYPIRCIECGKKEVRPAVVRRQIKKNHDGRLYDLTIVDLPVTRCDACGEIFFTEESDEGIAAALRTHLALLTPEQIRANLESLAINQKEAAERIGVAAETISRWLSGAMIQSRAMDNLLRAFFACPEVREELNRAGKHRGFGETVRVA